MNHCYVLPCQQLRRLASQLIGMDRAWWWAQNWAQKNGASPARSLVWIRSLGLCGCSSPGLTRPPQRAGKSNAHSSPAKLSKQAFFSLLAACNDGGLFLILLLKAAHFALVFFFLPFLLGNLTMKAFARFHFRLPPTTILLQAYGRRLFGVFVTTKRTAST